MAITPKAGWMIDPNNPNNVVRIGTVAPNPTATSISSGAVNTPTPQYAPAPAVDYASQQGAEKQRLAMVAEENRKNALLTQANQLRSSGVGTTGTASYLNSLSGADRQLVQGMFGSNVPAAPTVLSTAQQKAYYSSQGNVAKPLSPSAWLAQQTPSYTPSATLTGGDIQGGTTNTFQTTPENASDVNTALAAAKVEADARATKATEQKAQAENLGKTESDLSTFIRSAMSGNEESAGKSLYQVEQNKAFGVTTAQMTKNSLEAKQRGLLAKAAAIDLEVQQGQGVTTAIDQRQRTEAKRVIAIESLINTAFLAAADGDLANAKAQADEAVSLKYGPLEEAQKIRLANLELLSKDPNISLEQKNRAVAATAIVKAQETQIAQQKVDEAAILKIAVDAISYTQNFTPTPQYPTAAQALDGIKNAPDPITAAQIAASVGLYKKEAKATGGGAMGAIDNGQPFVAVTDPTKTTAQNNMQTLQQVFQSSKVSAGNKTSIGNGLALAKAAQDLADANIDGTFSGFSPFRVITDMTLPGWLGGGGVIPFREALKRNKTIQNEAMISALQLQTEFWASGAALSDPQTELVKKMIPTVNNTDTQIRTKVNQLINYMLSQTSSRLITDGIDFKPAKVDMFETVGLLDRASPEQLKQLQAAGLTQ